MLSVILIIASSIRATILKILQPLSNFTLNSSHHREEVEVDGWVSKDCQYCKTTTIFNILQTFNIVTMVTEVPYPAQTQTRKSNYSEVQLRMVLQSEMSRCKIFMTDIENVEILIWSDVAEFFTDSLNISVQR